MIEEIKMVEAFQLQYGAPVLDTPTIPSAERCELKVSLIQEELNEIKEGIENNDIVEVIDGVADLLYVAFGLVNEFGLNDCIVAAFAEVHRSNMTKACATIEEAEETADFYRKKDNVESYIKPIGNTFVVYRAADNKILKSINYSPADLKQFA